MVVVGADCVTAEDDGRWHDQSHDTGNDFFGMGCAFLISLFIRWAIVGEVPSNDGELGGKDPWQYIILLVLSVFFLLVAGLSAALHHGTGTDGWCSCFFDWFSTVTSLTAAFCAVFGMMWACDYPDELIAHTGIALFFSIVAVCFIFWMALVKCVCPTANRIFRGMFTGIGLAVGMSWEKTFDAATDGLGDFVDQGAQDGDTLRRAALVKIAVQYLLVFVVLPAWTVYMLPKANDEIAKAMSESLEDGNLPLRAYCCDSDLYNVKPDAGEEASGDDEPLL